VPPFAAFAPVSASRAFLPFGVVQREQIARILDHRNSLFGFKESQLTGAHRIIFVMQFDFGVLLIFAQSECRSL
jgi:hypothetical protein